MDDNFPWAFADGASQGWPRLGGARGIIHLSPYRSIHFATGLGEASNNQAELAAVNILLRLTLELGVDRLQVAGDSLLVVDCLKMHKAPVDIFLLPLFEDIDRVRTHFSFLSFQHIFREANAVAYGLSKKDLFLSAGYSDRWEMNDG